jgi:hypothetical protein
MKTNYLVPKITQSNYQYDLKSLKIEKKKISSEI